MDSSDSLPGNAVTPAGALNFNSGDSAVMVTVIGGLSDFAIIDDELHNIESRHIRDKRTD